MNLSYENFAARVIAERVRQFNLPGSEYDACNGPNDWISLIVSYAARGVAKKHSRPVGEDFEDDLIKVAAIVFAALEHIPTMTAKGLFREPGEHDG